MNYLCFFVFFTSLFLLCKFCTQVTFTWRSSACKCPQWFKKSSCYSNCFFLFVSWIFILSPIFVMIFIAISSVPEIDSMTVVFQFYDLYALWQAHLRSNQSELKQSKCRTQLVLGWGLFGNTGYGKDPHTIWDLFRF